MRLENNEYDIVDEAINDGGVGIFIEKAALEKWRKHYLKLTDRYWHDTPEQNGASVWRLGVLTGKASVLTDLLKHFEEEGV